MLTLFCLVLVLLQHVKSEGAAHWEYEGEHGPEHWYENYPECNGKEQSPIKIEYFETEPRSFEPLKFHGYEKKNMNMVLQNNGHTVQLSPCADDEDVPYMEGGGLGSKYFFRQLHFHWGKKDSEGSEHIANENDGRTLEMHLVHTSPDAIENGQTGIAVLGVALQASDKEDNTYQCITKALKDVVNKGSKTTIETGPSLQSLLPNNNLENLDFFRYNGSLTTPPCTEGVIWTVLREVTHISHKQMELFRELKSTAEDEPNSKSMSGNFRPIQDLNSRTVYRSIH